jgi:hypothetical protein
MLCCLASSASASALDAPAASRPHSRPAGSCGSILRRAYAGRRDITEAAEEESDEACAYKDQSVLWADILQALLQGYKGEEQVMTCVGADAEDDIRSGDCTFKVLLSCAKKRK